MKKILLPLAMLCMVGSLHAQEIQFKSEPVAIVAPAAYTFGSSVKTFDVKTVAKDDDNAFASKEAVAKVLAPLTLSLGTLNQVDDGGDFHVIPLIRTFLPKSVDRTADGYAFVTNVSVYTRVYDKFGKIQYENAFVNPAQMTRINTKWSKDELLANSGTVTTQIVREAVLASLAGYEKNLHINNDTLTVRLAYFKKVKDKPELAAFEDQVKELKPLLAKQDLAGFAAAASKYAPDWQKLAAYEGDGNVVDIKRGAMQNLGLYYILSKDTAAARALLAQYKPVDKYISEMMGLIKYKNSNEEEQLLNRMSPTVTVIDIANSDEKVMTAQELGDNLKFTTIKGTVTLKGKKIAGTYNGVIKVATPEPKSSGGGGISDLSADDLNIIVEGTDADGQAKTIKAMASDIVSMKDTDGNDYLVRKYGSVLTSNATFDLMKQSYKSDKIIMYTSIVPANGDFYIRKPNDDKGVASSLLNQKKNIVDYLSDCSKIGDNFNNGAYKNATIRKVVEDYTNCQ